MGGCTTDGEKPHRVPPGTPGKNTKGYDLEITVQMADWGRMGCVFCVCEA